MSGPLSGLGWRWAVLNGSGAAHLVPPQPGRWSRTACNRYPVAGAALSEPEGLLGMGEWCRSCRAANHEEVNRATNG